MVNYRVLFARPGSEDDYNRFLKQIDGYPEPGGEVRLSGRIARGTIRKFSLDAGFSMRIWDCVFQEPVILQKEALPRSLHETGLVAVYILTPENIVLKSVGSHQQFNRAWSKDAILVSDDVHMELLMQPHKPIQMIDFTVSAGWFEQQLKNRETPVKKAMHKPHEWNFPIIRIEPCSSRDSLVTNKLFHIAMHEKRDSPPLYSLSSCMITDFLLNVLRTDTRRSPLYKDIYYEKVMQVEAILQDHLQKNLPSLAEIAKQVMLSESTLKRYFKIFFGTSVYDYYLHKKMILAKSMLLEKMMTVNEVAELMGYEKVSNFIDIFKKHHGFSPGTIKKRYVLTKRPWESVAGKVVENT